MQRTEQLVAWERTAALIRQLLDGNAPGQWQQEFDQVVHKSELSNPWFTKKQVETAFEGIYQLLNPGNLEKWLLAYPESVKEPRNVGVIMAGNIPMAGFHDLLCVLLSGNRLIAKLASSDQFLLPFVAHIYFSFNPSQEPMLQLSSQLKNMDAVIATGSNNTGRYFEYYFGKKPHIFRKNRNSAGVLQGNENEFDFLLLGRDIFTYYGLGCRNVSKLYVPEGYDFRDFFANITDYSEVLAHNKYMNNYDYHQALYLLNRKPFLTNNFLIVTEERSLSSPVGVMHYEFYKNKSELEAKLESVRNEIQCVVSKNGPVLPGKAQFPDVADYADGVDTMDFLTTLKK